MSILQQLGDRQRDVEQFRGIEEAWIGGLVLVRAVKVAFSMALMLRPLGRWGLPKGLDKAINKGVKGIRL